MEEPKIVTLYMVKNQQKWIAKSIRSVYDITSEIIVLDGGSTDNTVEICESFEKVVEVKIEDEVTKPFDDTKNKNTLLEMAKRRNPDYIFYLDSDEIIQKNAKKIFFQDLKKYSDSSAFEFKILQMWDKPNMYRQDGPYGNYWSRKLLKMKDQPTDLSYQKTIFPHNMHCPMIPQNARGWYTPKRSNVQILHYGYYDPIVRQKKYEHYNRIDPKNVIFDQYKDLIELPSKFSGKYGLEFRYIPEGMYDKNI